jgi:hypothetical protein
MKLKPFFEFAGVAGPSSLLRARNNFFSFKGSAVKNLHIFTPNLRSIGKRRKAYGEVSSMVHLVRPLLAGSPSGSGLISNCLAASAAFPDYRNSGGRRAFIDRVYHHTAGQDPAQDLISEF